MRIDLVITELNVGGAERCLTELALALHRRGDRVRVASIAPLPHGDQAALVDRLRAAGITVQSAGCGRTWQAPRAVRFFRRWFAQGRPDVVQTMLYHANVVGTLAARLAGVPRCIGGVRVAEPKPLRLWIEGRAARRMDAVVCVSQAVRTFVQHAWGAAAPPMVVIGNAIDVGQVDAVPPADWSEFGWPGDAAVLLFVGRLHHQKGIDLLVQAAEPLLDRHPEMRCLIAGEGPQRPIAEAFADRWGNSRVRLAGWRRDVLELIKACRLLVLPSRYEGMPNAVLEAMAAGRPVAVTRVEGVSELLGERFAEQSCAPEDSRALSQLIARLWTSPATCHELGQHNRRQAEARFDLDAVALQYRQIYAANPARPD